MKKLLFLLFTISIVYSNIVLTFAQTLNIDPKCSYILIDSKSGQVLAEQNAYKKVHPASTTKIMTGIIAIEEGKPDSIMKVSQAAVRDIGPGGMNIGLMPDEGFLTLKDLLNVMLIKSANETANIIAENVGGTRAHFVDMMNDKAKQIGAVDTFFVNPCGMDTTKEEASHLTTARDMSIMARYAMNLPEFREIVGKLYYKDMPVTDRHSNWGILQNTNKLLWDVNSYPYTLNGVKEKYTVNGIKTGFTNLAGENLVSSAVSQEGMELIAVVMDVTQNNLQYTYTKALFKYGFENYSLHKIIEKGQSIKSIDVNNGKSVEKLDLNADNDLNLVLPVEINDQNLVTQEKINQDIKAPINKGDILGHIDYLRNGLLIGSINLVAAGSVIQEPAKTDKAQNVSGEDKKKYSTSYKVFLGFTAFIFLFIILIGIRRIYVVLRRRKKAKGPLSL